MPSCVGGEQLNTPTLDLPGEFDFHESSAERFCKSNNNSIDLVNNNNTRADLSLQHINPTNLIHNNIYNNNSSNSATPLKYQQVVDTKQLLQQPLYFNTYEPTTPADPWNIDNNLTFELFEDQLLSPPDQLLLSPTDSHHHLTPISPTSSSGISPTYEESTTFDLSLDHFAPFDFDDEPATSFNKEVARAASMYGNSSLALTTPPLMEGDESSAHFGDEEILRADVFITTDRLLNADDQNSLNSLSSTGSDFKGFEPDRATEAGTFRLQTIDHNYTLNCSENKTANLLGANSSGNNNNSNNRHQAKSIINQLDLNNVDYKATAVTDVKERQKIINHANSKSNKEVVDQVPRTRKPGLKVRLTPRDDDMTARVPKVSVATPDVTKDILDLEEERFDLVSYINAVTQESIDVPTPKPATVTTAKPIHSVILKRRSDSVESFTVKRSRLSTHSPAISDMNPGSVQSSTNSQDDDYESACSSQHESRPKRRGRPPKPIESRPMSPSEYSHLSEADWKYRELRNKNNEASRRSRQNRKAKESHIEYEANEMTRRYRVLEVQERKLIKQCAKWRKAVMALALI